MTQSAATFARLDKTTAWLSITRRGPRRGGQSLFLVEQGVDLVLRGLLVGVRHVGIATDFGERAVGCGSGKGCGFR